MTQTQPLLMSEMMKRQDPSQVEGLMRFFKTGKGQYGEGDVFLGIKVPVTRGVVKSCWRDTTLADLDICMASQYHEIRLAALLCLIQMFRHAKNDPQAQKRHVDFYLGHTYGINNWDLVDLSCYELLGTYLLDKDRAILYDLAKNGKTLWEQRIGIVSTMQFVRHGQNDDTFAIAETLLNHPHDLIHKAVGWLLREAGKRNEDELLAFLDRHHQTMPRTMLRYAIERLSDEKKRHFMQRQRKISTFVATK